MFVLFNIIPLNVLSYTILPGSNMKAADKRLGSASPTSFLHNSDRVGKVKLSTFRRPLSVQAAYRYNLWNLYLNNLPLSSHVNALLNLSFWRINNHCYNKKLETLHMIGMNWNSMDWICESQAVINQEPNQSELNQSNWYKQICHQWMGQFGLLSLKPGFIHLDLVCTKNCWIVRNGCLYLPYFYISNETIFKFDL